MARRQYSASYRKFTANTAGADASFGIIVATFGTAVIIASITEGSWRFTNDHLPLADHAVLSIKEFKQTCLDIVVHYFDDIYEI